MKNNYYIYIVAMALVTYLIRVLPLTLLRKPILFSTSRLLYGGMAFAVGIVLAWTSGNLFVVELGCCLVVLLMNAVLH